MNLFKTLSILLLSLSYIQAEQDEIIEEEEPKCKTVTTVENFDINIYASAPWYVHQQAENIYSPIEQNFCTSAEYTIRDEPTFWGYTVDVFNQAQYESGVGVEANLCAYQTNKSPSKLEVAPCFLPKFASGPYWVVAYDESEGYALISGGQPDILGENGLCSSGEGVNNSGLWIFSRSQDRNETLVDKVRTIAEEAGFDLSVLNDVNQTTCDSCGDTEGTIDVGFFFGEKDCEWIGNRFWGCWVYGGDCPETCGLC